MTGRIFDLLAMKYKGNWDDIYGAIKRKEPIDDMAFTDLLATLKANAITIIDKTIPTISNKPTSPVCPFYYGDLSLLDHPQETVAFIGSRKPANTERRWRASSSPT